jgi:excisionase family DNA binding protein
MLLSLKKAAEYLNQTPETVRRWAKAGKIPGSVALGEWRFIQEDLDAAIRSGYPRQWQSLATEATWQSNYVAPSGGSTSPHQTENELDTLLRQATRRKPKSTTTS